MDRAKIIKMVFLLAAITVIASGLIRAMQRNSLSLAEYEEQNKNLLQNAPSDSMPTADKSSGHSNEDDTGGSIPGTPESSTTDADEYISLIPMDSIMNPYRSIFADISGESLSRQIRYFPTEAVKKVRCLFRILQPKTCAMFISGILILMGIPQRAS